MWQGLEWLEEGTEHEFLCDADVTAEDLPWLKSDTRHGGYYGVVRDSRYTTKPFRARVHRGGKCVFLGLYATAEEAALRVAKTPEGQRQLAKARARASGC